MSEHERKSWAGILPRWRWNGRTVVILLLVIGFCSFSIVRALLPSFSRFGCLCIDGNTALSVNFTATGRILALGRADGTVRLWDIANGQEKTIFRVSDGRIECMAFSPDGRTLAFGTKDGGLKIWMVEEKQELADLRMHVGRVVTVAFAPDGKILASGGDDPRRKVVGPNYPQTIGCPTGSHWYGKLYSVLPGRPDTGIREL